MCRLRMCHNRYIEYTLMYIGYVEYNEYSFMYFITETILLLLYFKLSGFKPIIISYIFILKIKLDKRNTPNRKIMHYLKKVYEKCEINV